jgi:hypothetical protein
MVWRAGMLSLLSLRDIDAVEEMRVKIETGKGQLVVILYY